MYIRGFCIFFVIRSFEFRHAFVIRVLSFEFQPEGRNKKTVLGPGRARGRLERERVDGSVSGG
jgi:hypothetical protein